MQKCIVVEWNGIESELQKSMWDFGCALLFPLPFNHLATKGLYVYCLFCFCSNVFFSNSIVLHHTRALSADETHTNTKISKHTHAHTTAKREKEPLENNAAAYNRKLCWLCVSDEADTFREWPFGISNGWKSNVLYFNSIQTFCIK